MSLLKKLGAVAVGTASATAWIGAKTIEAGLEAVSDKLGKNGSCTGSNGCTYTGSDCKNAARKAGDFAKEKNGFVANGFKKAKELWNED
jgi:hypothetical protein